MTRLRFLLGLVGMGAAGQAVRYLHEVEPHSGLGWSVSNDLSEIRVRPTRGQCPVCGTVAKPYLKSDWASTLNTFPCAGSGGGDSVCRPATPSMAPSSRLIRCEFCSCAFWQDAEPVEHNEGH